MPRVTARPMLHCSDCVYRRTNSGGCNHNYIQDQTMHPNGEGDHNYASRCPDYAMETVRRQCINCRHTRLELSVCLAGFSQDESATNPHPDEGFARRCPSYELNDGIPWGEPLFYLNPEHDTNRYACAECRASVLQLLNGISPRDLYRPITVSLCTTCIEKLRHFCRRSYRYASYFAF